MHKVRNYLITLPDQPDLDKALVLLGILDRRGGLVAGVPRHIVARPCCRLAYIRGALIGPGVHASHGMERTHIEALDATVSLILAYLRTLCA